MCVRLNVCTFMGVNVGYSRIESGKRGRKKCPLSLSLSIFCVCLLLLNAMARCWQRLTIMNRTQWLANSKQKSAIEWEKTKRERRQGEKTRTHYGLAISISLENLWIIFSIEFGWIHNSNSGSSSSTHTHRSSFHFRCDLPILLWQAT